MPNYVATEPLLILKIKINISLQFFVATVFVDIKITIG